MRDRRQSLVAWLKTQGTTLEELRDRYGYTRNLELAGWAWEFWRRVILSRGGINLRIPLVGELPTRVPPLYRMTWAPLDNEERRAVISHHMAGGKPTPLWRVPWRSEDWQERWGEAGPYQERDVPAFDYLERMYENLQVWGVDTVHRSPIVVVNLVADRKEIEAEFKKFLDDEFSREATQHPELRRPKHNPCDPRALKRWQNDHYLMVWDLYWQKAPPVAIYREFFGDTDDGRKKYRRVLSECHDLIYGIRGSLLREQVVEP